MKSQDIKVGDMVRATVDFDKNTNGKIGKVVKVCKYDVLVDFGEEFEGHNGLLDGVGGSCWYMPPCFLEPVALPKIIITTDGTTTTARRYEGKRVMAEATAKCSPDDTFSFDAGAATAFDRLMGRKSKQPVEDKPAFVPHMEVCGYHYGNLGEPTNYKDIYGSPLRVGDTVKLCQNNGEEGLNETPMVKTNLLYRGGTIKAYIEGIECVCNDNTGDTGNYKIELNRRHENIKDGEKIFGVAYIKTPRS